MKVVVDRNIPFASAMFAGVAETVVADGHAITPDLVRDADALLVRSVTPVGAALLDGSRVRFVGTATIGCDHVDQAWLRSRGIGFASAPGSNATSVAEYLVAALLTLARRLGRDLGTMTLGVVGAGNVGSRVAARAKALGMRVLCNDPPLARRSTSAGFVPLDELMEADVVTLHVPLLREGEDATFHLFDARRLARMKPGAILVNTSRGAVVETLALRDALGSGRLEAAVLDVWEGEPAIDTGLLARVALGTAHIAGYSTDGKAAGARMVHEALCGHFGIAARWDFDRGLPAPEHPRIALDDAPRTFQQAADEAVRLAYPIERDDAALRGLLGLPREQQGAHFRALRSRYPVRREFAATTLGVPARLAGDAARLEELGFRVERIGGASAP